MGDVWESDGVVVETWESSTEPGVTFTTVIREGDIVTGGSGVDLSDATPAALGTAAPGVGTEASRADHVHGMPTAADVGAAAASHTHNGTQVTIDTADFDGILSAADSTVQAALETIDELSVSSGVHQQQPKYSTNDTWAVPGQSSQFTNFKSMTISANTVYYVPFVVPTPITVTAIAVPLTAGNAAGNLRLGIYAADTDWQPTGAPLLDSGDISTSTVAVKSATGLSVTLPAGRYVHCLVSDLAGWSTRAGSTGNGYLANSLDGILIRWRASLTYGAFPSTPVAWTTADSNPTPSDPMIVLRWTA